MVNRRVPAGSPRLLRTRAVLAAALVLGVDTTSTLAAWTDSEYGTGSFTARVFGTESPHGLVVRLDRHPHDHDDEGTYP
ncbi:hypothetical protein FF096_15465 [Micromonospora sp. CP22]|nr:hypothetical protein [Micromonospora sp. CP22]